MIRVIRVIRVIRAAVWLIVAHFRAKLAALRTSAWRERPYGGDAWTRRTADQLGLLHTLRERGRPRKQADDAAQTLMF